MKQVIALSVALAASMVGSYLTWTNDTEPVETDGTDVYRAGEGDLATLTWKSDDRTIVVTRKTDALGDYLWLESQEVRKVPRPVEPSETPEDGAPPLTPEIEMVEEVTEVAFAGNAAAEKLWSDFQPLVALRELPDAPSLDAATFGLEEPTGTVTVGLSGRELELLIGGETYGSKDRYAKVDQRVFLLDDGDLRPLQFAASRLVERSLFPLLEEEVEEVVVRGPSGDALTFIHKHRDDRAAAFWAWSSHPNDPDDQVDAWVGRALKVKLRSYTTAEEAGALRPFLTYEVRGKGQAYPIELLEDAGGTVYARSGFNRSLVELTDSLVDGLSDELSELTPPTE